MNPLDSAEPRNSGSRMRSVRGSIVLPVALGSGLAAVALVLGARTALDVHANGPSMPAGEAGRIEVRLEWAPAGRTLSEPAVLLAGASTAGDAVLRLDAPVLLARAAWRSAEPVPLVPGWRLRPVLPSSGGAPRGAPARCAIHAVPMHHVLVRAVDAQTGEPVRSFRATIEWRAEDERAGSAPAAQVQDDAGAVLFEGVPLAEGAVRIELDAAGHAPVRTAWQRLDPSGWLELSVALEPR